MCFCIQSLCYFEDTLKHQITKINYFDTQNFIRISMVNDQQQALIKGAEGGGVGNH